MHSFILIEFYLFVIFLNFELILLETRLNFAHVVFVGVDELNFLAFEHIVDFILQAISEKVELLDQIFDFPCRVLDNLISTLYL